MAEWIFLDNHSKSKPSQKLLDEWSKDSRLHWQIAPVKQAKEKIQQLTYSGNLYFAENAHFDVHFSHYMHFIRETGRTHVLSLETEHFPSLTQLEKLELVHKKLPVNANGQLTKKILQESIRPRSSLISLHWAHPLTGVIQPIDEILSVAKENDIRIHVDISSAIGKLFLPVFDADFITFSTSSLHFPSQYEAVLVSPKCTFTPSAQKEGHYASIQAMASAIEIMQDKIDHFALEIARLRNLFENKMKALGAHIFFQEAERLPNTSVFAFDFIHSETLVDALKKEGLFATQTNLAQTLIACGVDPILAHSSIAVALSDETTQEEITRAIEIIGNTVSKLMQTPSPFIEEDAKAKQMRICTSSVGEKEIGKWLTISLLIDEEDGVIADMRFETFGPPSLTNALKATSKLLLRKNYIQAKRLSADLIEKEAGKEAISHLNLILDAIDLATESCLDIPIDDVYVAPPEMSGGERQEYPGWESLSDREKKAVISSVMETDIQPYVELDAGGVEVVKVEDNRVTIAYSGNCTSCYSATGATLDAIGNILRHKIYPDLMVIPDMTLLQSNNGV